MKTSPLLLALALGVALPAPVIAQPAGPASPGIWHSYFMRGSVVDGTGSDVVLCVGKIDGAEPGQTLKAYRVKPHPHGPKGPAAYVREEVGAVRIADVIDAHFARAKVVAGDVRKHDIVELQRPSK